MASQVPASRDGALAALPHQQQHRCGFWGRAPTGRTAACFPPIRYGSGLLGPIWPPNLQRSLFSHLVFTKGRLETNAG